MKRFYCSTCKKVKRVQRLPANVENPKAEDVTLRIGKCKWHSDKGRISHRASIGNARVHHPRFSKAKVAPTPPKKQKAAR